MNSPPIHKETQSFLSLTCTCNSPPSCPSGFGILPPALARRHSCLLAVSGPLASVLCVSHVSDCFPLVSTAQPFQGLLVPCLCQAPSSARVPLLGAEYFSNHTGLFLLIPLDSAQTSFPCCLPHSPRLLRNLHYNQFLACTCIGFYWLASLQSTVTCYWA